MANDQDFSKPPGHTLAQKVFEGVLHRSRKADVITFKMHFLLLELTFIVTVPEEGKSRAPVYCRWWIDRSKGDLPGSVVIE